MGPGKLIQGSRVAAVGEKGKGVLLSQVVDEDAARGGEVGEVDLEHRDQRPGEAAVIGEDLMSSSLVLGSVHDKVAYLGGETHLRGILWKPFFKIGKYVFSILFLFTVFSCACSVLLAFF